MKTCRKSYKLFSLAALLSMAACQGELPLEETISKDIIETRTLKVLMQQSKTTIQYEDDDFSATSSLVWSEGDQVSYWVSTDNGESWNKSQSAEVLDDSSFEAKIPYDAQSVKIKVLYPQIADNCDFNEGVTVSHEQSMNSENEFDGSNLKMLGESYIENISQTTESINVFFNTVGHVIRIRLKGSESDKVTSVGIKVSGEDEYILNVVDPNGISLSSEGKYFYIVIPTGERRYRPSSVTTSDGTTYLFGGRTSLKDFEANGMTRTSISLTSFTKIEKKLFGQIIDNNLLNGIEGVPVSDGYSFCSTDANGVYQIAAADSARTVAVTIPSEYEIPLTLNEDYTAFYAHLSGNASQRHDFTLKPLEDPENEFSLYVLGDIHLNDNSQNIFRTNIMDDLEKVMKEYLPDFKNPYLISVGDINNGFGQTLNLEKEKEILKNITLEGGRRVPFFATIGNHDHYSEDTKGEHADYSSANLWVSQFGPNNYSFNRGGAHIVIIDNVIAYAGATDAELKIPKFYGGLTEKAYKWLCSDLELVDKDKTVILVCHIPFMKGGEDDAESPVRKSSHYADVLNLLGKFNQAHIISGHVHNPRGYIHYSDDPESGLNHLTSSGQPIYEHNLRSVCGIGDWPARICHDGSPVGYSVFQIKDGSVYNYLSKSAGKPFGSQIRVYDGNDTYGGNSTWSEANNSDYTNKLIISIPADDDSAWPDSKLTPNWTVTLINNGERIPVKKYHGLLLDYCGDVFWKVLDDEKGKERYKGASKNTHFWVADISANDLDYYWVVEAIQTIPFSGVKNYYYCSEITRNFDGWRIGSSGDFDGDFSYRPGLINVPWTDDPTNFALF